MGLHVGLEIGDVSLHVLVSCSVKVLDEAVRVELEWLELGLWAVLGLGMAFLTLMAH